MRRDLCMFPLLFGLQSGGAAETVSAGDQGRARAGDQGRARAGDQGRARVDARALEWSVPISCNHLRSFSAIA